MSEITCNVAGRSTLAVSVDTLVMAGWAGRDAAKVESHILELAELGVKRPKSTPCFYRVAPSLLTAGQTIDVLGSNSSGEVEVALLSSSTHGLLIGVGSDHTDREVEAYDISVSKQMCDKPIRADWWLYDDLASQWDQLVMRSWRWVGPRRELYQEGTTAQLLDPLVLVRKLCTQDDLPGGTVVFCGTQPVIGRLVFGDAFEIELHDPVLKRSRSHRYGVRTLPGAE